jgi:cytochrome P450
VFDVIDAEAAQSAYEIAVDAVFYFAASFHTTSTTICFVLAFVVSHRAVYEKLRTELAALTADRNGLLSYNDLAKSQYLVGFASSISN